MDYTVNKSYVDFYKRHKIKILFISFVKAEAIFRIPWAPNMVAFTVDKIFNCVPIVGILSQTWSKFWNNTMVIVKIRN